MEEKKNIAKIKTENAPKLSYDDLKKKAGDLFLTNQKMESYIKKMEEHIRQLEQALDDQSFNQMSFFISTLFKVVEHPEMYKEEFVSWCVERIETALVSFASPVEEKKDEPAKEETEGAAE